MKYSNLFNFSGHEFSARQVSGADESGQFLLAVVVKKTYHVLPDGHCEKSIFQQALNCDLALYSNNYDLLEHDSDLYPIKNKVDIVVKGKIRPPQPMNNCLFSIQIGENKNRMLAIGERHAWVDFSGKINFTNAEKFEEIPLRYDYAYGGRDKYAETLLEPPSSDVLNGFPPDFDWLDGHETRYPKNPGGRGFLIKFNKNAIESVDLPMIEDEEHRLLPQKLVLRDPRDWIEMPPPRGTDWINPAWFPRMAYFNLFNPVNNLPVNLVEITRNWVDKDIFYKNPLPVKLISNGGNGASLGLQIPFFVGNKTCEFINIWPDNPCFIVQLPNESPKIWTDGRNNGFKATNTVVQTVIFEPENHLVSIVWRGCAPALRPYLDKELENMPFRVQF